MTNMAYSQSVEDRDRPWNYLANLIPKLQRQATSPIANFEYPCFVSIPKK
jgi:hypothetical protein